MDKKKEITKPKHHYDMIGFPLYRQHDQMDCGPTCLRMVARITRSY